MELDKDKVRILVADDHAMVRMGLISLLGTVSRFSVVGEAEDGAEAVRLASRLRPDIVLMDVMMPKVDGIEATRRIVENRPETKVILVTSFSSSDGIVHGLRAGACGAILKSSDFASLVSTITDVADGKTVVSPEIRQLLAKDPPLGDLSERQSEILHSIVRGLYDNDIAQQLGISVYTVKEHINALFAKIGASNRAEAVAIALRKHLLKM